MTLEEKVYNNYKKNKKISIDVDEVLLETFSNALKNINNNENLIKILKNFNLYPLKKEDIKHFYFLIDLFGKDIGNSFFDKEVLYHEVNLIENSKDLINICIEKDLNFQIVTSTHQNLFNIKNRLLKENFNIDIEKIIHAHNKTNYVIDGIFLDDGLHNLTPILEHNNSVAIVFDKPWNTNINHVNLNRIYNLKELVEILRKNF